jgi:predicted nucleotidyltransferase
MSVLNKIEKANPHLFASRKWLSANTSYLTYMGSHAYGTATDTSDIDLYGFCLPPLDHIFPHTKGHVEGFGPKPERFEHMQIANISMPGEKVYDLTIYSIQKYFNLLAGQSPNTIDSIWTPHNCIAQITEAGQLVRDNRKLFLTRHCYDSLRGFASQNIGKAFDKTKQDSKRREVVEKYGFDVKAAAHIVRLTEECYDLLTTGEMDMQKSKEVVKAIRRGEWTETDVREWFMAADKILMQARAETKLPAKVDFDRLRELLLNCIESHYGSVSTVMNAGVVRDNRGLLDDLKELVSKYDRSDTVSG